MQSIYILPKIIISITPRDSLYFLFTYFDGTGIHASCMLDLQSSTELQSKYQETNSNIKTHMGRKVNRLNWDSSSSYLGGWGRRMSWAQEFKTNLVNTARVNLNTRRKKEGREGRKEESREGRERERKERRREGWEEGRSKGENEGRRTKKIP
jgi:hypothetical protein